MSEEAAAAIDADSAKDKSSSSKSGSHRLDGSAGTNGYHDMDGNQTDQGVDGEAYSDGVKTVDVSQVAEKVCAAILWRNSKQVMGEGWHIECCAFEVHVTSQCSPESLSTEVVH